MAFMKIDQEVVSKASNGGAYITDSGIYEVTVGALTLDVNEHGARQIGAYVTLDGENYQMLYGALPLDLFDNSQELDNNVKTLMRIATVAGFEDIEDPVEAVLPIGKEGADKDCMVFEQFEGTQLKLWVKAEYNKGKDGRIYESRIIKDAFRVEDNASADEIVNDTEAGTKYSKREAYFEEVKYKDTDKEEVDQWIADGRPKTTSSSSSTAAKPKKSFGAKKFGAK